MHALLLITHMDWMLDSDMRTWQFGHVAYTDDLVLLESTQSELQRALGGFNTVCAEVGNGSVRTSWRSCISRESQDDRTSSILEWSQVSGDGRGQQIAD